MTKKLQYFSIAAALLVAVALNVFPEAQPLAYAGSILSPEALPYLAVIGLNLQALRDKRNAKVAEMRRILDDAGENALTDEQVAKYDALDKEVDALNGQIKREERLTAVETDLRTADPAVAERQALGRAAPPAAREFESIGQFLYAVRFSPNDQRLEWHQPSMRGEHEMSDGTSGGFAVPRQFRGEFMEVTPQQAIIRPRAMVIPAGSPPDAEISMPALDQTGDSPANVYGGVSVTWTKEGADTTEANARLREISLQPQEVSGHVIVTDKLLRNWQAAAPTLTRLLRGAVVSAEEHKFLTGAGTGAPLGFVNAGAAYAVTRSEANHVRLSDIYAMEARVLMRGGSPLWIASQSIMADLQGMRNYSDDSPALGDGALVWNPDLRDANGNQLLRGRPILWSERSPLLGTKGDLALVDLSYYLIKDGSGPFVAASEHVHFKANKTVIKIVWNVDGQPWLTAPFKQEKTYEVSPFVVLN